MYSADIEQLIADSDKYLERMRWKEQSAARVRFKDMGIAHLSNHDMELLDLSWCDRAAARTKEQALAARRAAVTRVLRPQNIVFRTPLLAQLNAHAIDLVLTHELHVTLRNDLSGMADFDTRTIQVPAATCEEAYAVILHEIGHIVEPTADSRQYAYEIRDSTKAIQKRVIRDAAGRISGIVEEPSARGAPVLSMHAYEGEVSAWRFAAAHAVTWTVAMQDRMFRSMLHHAHDATPDQRFDLTVLVGQAATRISDRPWTFAELSEKQARLTANRDVSTLTYKAVEPGTADELATLHTRLATVETSLAQAQKDAADANRRVVELERLPRMRYGGVWEPGTRYRQGDCVTHQGSTWHCDVEHQDVRPPAPQWTLMVKRGSDRR